MGVGWARHKNVSFYVFEEHIFPLIEIFQIMPKLMMKLRQGNLYLLTISSFNILGWVH